METLKGWVGIALFIIMIVIHAVIMNRKEEKYWNAKVPTEPEDGHLRSIGDWEGS